MALKLFPKENIREKVLIHANLACIYLKLSNYQKVIEETTKTLDYEPRHIKSLIRRGKAYQSLKEFEKAELDFNNAQKLTETMKNL
jgi:tetratricopeptide (TPR) repeat protein